MAQACLTKRIPYLGFGLTETHVVELEKYLIMWVKDMMGTEGHPLCRQEVVVAKAAAEADKPKDMTGEDNHKKDKHDSRGIHTRTTRKQSSEESEEDSDKDKKKNRRQSIKQKQAVQEEVLGRERQREFLSRGVPDLAFARGGMGFARAGPAWVDRSSLTRWPSKGAWFG